MKGEKDKSSPPSESPILMEVDQESKSKGPVDLREVWFQLYDEETGQPYKGSAATTVKIKKDAEVAGFLQKVINDYQDSTKLQGFDSSDLRVYRNKDSFDKRKPDKGTEKPLKGGLKIVHLGFSAKEALIVVVPPVMNEVTKQQRAFKEMLKLGNIDRPRTNILAIIAKRYSQQLQAVLAMDDLGCCIDLYETVRELPASFTLGVIQNSMDISINGPISLAQPNLFFAVDLKNGIHLYIKLLRIPQTTANQTYDAKQNAVTAEINTCNLLFNENIPGLVECKVVEVPVHHSEGLDVSPEIWGAIKMRRYICSLSEVAQLSENWLYTGFTRVFNALKRMHELELVHMDVKSDNLFVDSNSQWDLGDFGSTRRIGEQVWSYTKVLTPYCLPSRATVIPAMDHVLLCVTIAVEMAKDGWKTALCGAERNVQENLIIERLNSIQNVQFKNEVLNLFQESLRIVKRHLKIAN